MVAKGTSKQMSKKLTILLLTLAVLISLSVGYVLIGLQAYAHYQWNSQANQEHCGGQPPVRICVQAPTAIFSAFYPSYVANHNNQFMIKYSSSSPVTLLINVDIPGFTRVQTRTVNASPTLQSISFTPPLLDHALRNFTAEDNTSLHVWVTDTQDHNYYINDTPLLLHSRWLMQWVAANRLMIAAWVTPNDPAVADLVAKSMRYLPSEPAPTPKAMIGYNQASRKQVADQVDAIFDALRIDYKIQYVQASVPYGGPAASTEDTQVIKLPSEVLQQHSGMCVELTVLLASAVESIGLDAEIVIIPGHAFLGVAVTPGDRHFQYWDAVLVNNNVAGTSANVFTDSVYAQNVKQHTILDTILIDDARKADIDPMV
jgi:hypothetical protein